MDSGLVIDYAERRASVAGRSVHLTPTEYELLFELSVNAGRVLTFDALLDRVWGLGRSGDRGSVRTYVKRLRRKLRSDMLLTKTLRGLPQLSGASSRSGSNLTSRGSPPYPGTPVKGGGKVDHVGVSTA